MHVRTAATAVLPATLSPVTHRPVESSQMNVRSTSRTTVAVLAALVLVSVALGVGVARAQTYLTFSHPEQARFRLLAEEGVAQPDQRQFVPAAKIWTVADKASGQCYTLFFTGAAMAAVGPNPCPP